MVGTPWTWDDRAKAALSLFLEGSGDQSMKEYFRQLSWNHDTETVAWILTTVVKFYGIFHRVLQCSNVSTKKKTCSWEKFIVDKILCRFTIMSAHITLSTFSDWLRIVNGPIWNEMKSFKPQEMLCLTNSILTVLFSTLSITCNRHFTCRFLFSSFCL